MYFNMYDYTTKLTMGGKEYTAIPTEDLKDLYQRAYNAGFEQGYQYAYEKTFWDDGK